MGKGILFIVAAAVLAGGTMLHGLQRTAFESDRQVSQYEAKMLAREVARTGFGLARKQMLADFQNFTGSSITTKQYEGGTFTVGVEPSGPGRKRLTVVGTYEGADGPERYQMQAVIADPLMAAFPAAVMVDASAGVSYNGNRFKISGIERNGSNKNVHGVLATKSQTKQTFVDNLGSTQEDQVVGAAGQKDIQHGQMMLDLKRIHTEALSYAHTAANVSNGTAFDYDTNKKFTGNTQFGSADNPVVMTVHGDVEFGGTVEGHGLLLVEGNLKVATGNFKWNGLIYVTQQADLDMSFDLLGNAAVNGVLVLQHNPLHADHFGEYAGSTSSTLNFKIGGSSSAQYDLNAIKALAPRIPAISEKIGKPPVILEYNEKFL